MIVEGVEIPEDVIKKATVWACTERRFTYQQLQAKLYKLFVEPDITYRLADRLQQKWKKEGKIRFVRGYWTWQV